MAKQHSVTTPAVNSGSGGHTRGRDGSGYAREVPGEHPATYTDDRGVNAERGRGFLSGDGQMHSHRP